MNERIKELMAQAGFDPAAIERMGVMPQAEKFAELIIKECTNMLPEDSIRKDGVHMYYVIREHFGISLFRGDGE